MPSKGGTKLIATNKKAYHEYFVDDRYEAGIALFGTEVKSVRLGQVNLKDCYCSIKNNEIFVNGMHISPYEKGNIFNRDPIRQRKLLMHKREIIKLASLSAQKGFSLIPLSLYFKEKLYDKRETDAKNEARREMERAEKSSREKW